MSLRRGTEAPALVDLNTAHGAWNQAAALESLTPLNEKCLDLLAEQSAAQPNGTNLLPRQVCEIWRTLDASARRRAANCPFLLFDVGFAEPGRWQWPEPGQVNDAAQVAVAPYFTLFKATVVAREVF